MEIGSKIRRLRILKNLTQEELADRAELSKGFISQLERDLTSPSIETLMDILQCLGTTPASFFGEKNEEQIVFGKNDYFEKRDPDLKNRIQWIIPNAQKNMMEPILLTLEAGAPPTRTIPMTERSSVMSSPAPQRFISETTSGMRKRETAFISPATGHTSSAPKTAAL